jgi:Tfp pilus assembly protein PilO
MKPIYKKYFTIIALIWSSCFVVFLLAYMFVLAPQRKSRKQIEGQLAVKKQVYSSAQKAAQEETQKQLSEQLRHLQDKLGRFVVDSEDLANLTFDIGKMASERGVGSFGINIVDKFPVTGESEGDCLREDKLHISFTGGFNQFAAVLSALERYQPVVFVDEFAINRDKRSALDHRASMDLAVFVKKQQDG